MAEVSLGTNITAAQYNDLRTRMINVAATYGITQALIESYLGTTWPAVTAGSVVNNTHWDKLFLVIYWCRVHQTNAPDVGLPAVANNAQWNSGEPIYSGDGYEYDANGVPIGPGNGDGSQVGPDKGYNDLEEAVLECENAAYTHAAGQFSSPASSATAADTSTTAWGGGTNASNLDGSVGLELAGDNSIGQIRREFDITFSNTTVRDRFFALGGSISVYVRMTNSNGVPLTSDPGTAKANWWYNHLNVADPINLEISKQIFDVLTTSYQTFILKSDSDDTTYNMNRTTVEVKKNAGNTTISFRIICADNDRSLKSWPDEPRDENVGQRVSSWVGIKNITGATNPLFNTVGCIPSVSITQNWVAEQIPGLPPTAVPPTPPSIPAFSVSNKGDLSGYGTTTYNVGSFTIPADNWRVVVQGNAYASGNVDTILFGTTVTNRDYGGDCQWIVRAGSTSGTVVYDSGVLFGRSSGYSSKGFLGQFLKSGTGSVTYYVQFRSYEENAAVNTGGVLNALPTFTGYA